MTFDVLTLFPGLVETVLSESIIGRAEQSGAIKVATHNIRDYSLDKHRRVDDTPYGGGMGMLLRPEPICACYDAVRKMRELPDSKTRCIFMSPSGKVLTQARAAALARDYDNLIILCGHYEGIDERVCEEIVDEEISIGDYVLTGGEIPACILVDSVARHIEGVLASPECYEKESHSAGLLEYPQYTRPAVFRGRAVPQVLVNGNHAEIEKWREEKSYEKTAASRPDMLARVGKRYKKAETVRINSREPYDVLVGSGLLSAAGEIIASICPEAKNAVIVTEETVDALYCKKIGISLKKAGIENTKIIFESGETLKSAGNYLKLIGFLGEKKIRRSDVIIALGGGTVGDIAGFAAATYMRGIKYIQMPTTLLAAVDSSVGGKTAIDTEAGKNLAGAFHNPAAVICDASVLKTLTPGEISSGFAEIIKYGIICDRKFFAELLSHDADYYFSDIEILKKLICRCVEAKKRYVEADELDMGERRALNFGHTVGHAVETLSEYSLSHGEAVAIGMAAETKLSLALDCCENADAVLASVEEILKKYKLPEKCEFDYIQVYKQCSVDKKHLSDGYNLPILQNIGSVKQQTVADDSFKVALEKALTE